MVYQTIAEFVITAMQMTWMFSVRLVILIFATSMSLLFVLDLTIVIHSLYMLFVFAVTVTARRFMNYFRVSKSLC